MITAEVCNLLSVVQRYCLQLHWSGLFSSLGMEVVKYVITSKICNLLSALQRGLGSIKLV